MGKVMFGILILLFASLTILFLLPLVVSFKIGNSILEVFSSIAVGVGTYLIDKLIFEKMAYKVVYKLFPFGTSIWNNQWISGMIYGLILTLPLWIVVALIMYLCHRTEKWSNAEGRNAIVGIAMGSLDAYWMWGSYLFQLADRCVHGISIADQGLRADYMINQVVQCVLTFLLIVGLVYVIRYGVAVKMTVLCAVAAILTHSFMRSFLFWLPNQAGLMKWAGTVFYGIIATTIFLLGRKLLGRADQKDIGEFEN